MRRITRRPAAERDLVEIWHYTAAHWDADQADGYLRAIAARIETLFDFPELGSDYGHVRPGYRRLRVERHRVFYRIGARGIEIVRVLHERMDIDDAL